jgi:hypothetical protein
MFTQAKIRVTYAVSPLDDASFEVAQEKSTLLTFLPRVGQKVRISYDPKDHDRFEDAARDRGALGAAEFETQKAKILAET